MGGSSSSSSSNQTSNVDKRQVVDGQGIGVSSDSSTVSVTNNSLDGNAIGKAFDFASSNDIAAGKSVEQVLNLAGHFLDTGAQLLDKQSAVLNQQGQMVAAAYQDAKGQTQDNKYLIAGALAVVGVVAVSSLRAR